MFEVLLAYALFIIVMAIPYMVVAAVACTFLGGVAALVSGILRGRTAKALVGVVLMIGSGAAAMTIAHWATSRPTDASATSAHRVVYQTYQGMRARQQAMRWLRDGTFTKLAKEQRARDAER
jgi:thiol:disulfide interchange protein